MPCKGLEGSEVGFVYLFELALCITLDLSKPGWAVEIEVDIQVIPVEVIDASSMALGNVHMPHVFSNNRPIFPFNQRIVIALARARLGLLNTELVQQPGNYMIDELRAVIGMKVENLEGELGNCFLQGWREMGVEHEKGKILALRLQCIDVPERDRFELS